MSAIADPCYVCNDPIEPSEKKWVAMFDVNRRVCIACAEGIHEGVRHLATHGVVDMVSTSIAKLRDIKLP